MNWKPILDRATRLVFDTPALDYLRDDLPEIARLSRSLMHPGATPQEIAELEARLGLSLPQSYREFLEATNGMACYTLLDRFLPAAEVNWFRVLRSDWCEILHETSDQWPPHSRVYPNDDWPARYVHSLVQVNSSLDGDTVLLNPEVTTAGGEWEAYRLFSHGSTCYASFGDLMRAALEHDEEYYRENPEDPTAHLQPLWDQTRSARAGHTQAAKTEMEKMFADGLDAAAAPLAEIAAFQGEWRRCCDLAFLAMGSDPQLVRLMNLPALCAVAALHLGNWEELEAMIAFPRRSDPGAGSFHESWWQRVDSIREFVATRGKSSVHWGMPFSLPEEARTADLATRRVQWEAFCDQSRRDYPRHWKTPADETRNRFTWAIQYQLPDDAMRIAREHPGERLPDPHFQIAEMYMRMDRQDDAWNAILFALPLWEQTGDFLRVAPVELLIDSTFRPLMTAERCAQVLATGRP